MFRIGVWIFGLSAALALGQNVPPLVNYQGRVKQADGTPLADGSYSLTFTLYNAASGGTPQWSETQTVTTAGGLYHALLGSTSALSAAKFPAGAGRWLGVKIGSDDELIPRQQIVSVPFAFRADTVSPGSIDSAALGSDAASLAKVSAGAMSATIDGKIGIGTSPLTALDVAGTIRLGGLLMPTGAAAGRVLTADATGAGTWQTPSIQALATTAKARAWRNGDQQNLINDQVTIVQLNAVSYDPGSNFNTSSTYGFTAPVSGYYLVTGNVRYWQLVANTRIAAVIVVNGGITNFNCINVGAGPNFIPASVSDIMHLNAGDLLQLAGRSESGNNEEDIDGRTEATWMSVHLLSY